MKERYIVLRSAPASGVSYGGPSGGTREAETVSAEVEDIDSLEAPELAREADVEAVARDIPMRLIEPVESRNTAIPASTGIAWGIEAVGADTTSLDGAGITIAVVDTGIDATHPAFAGMDIEQKDFTGEGDGDTHGHGTHCAGTIFGRDTEGTRIGVARGVKKALIAKVIAKDGAGSAQIVEAVLWAMSNGANVISMSIGIDFPGYVKKLEKKGLPTERASTIALEGYATTSQLFGTLARLIQQESIYQPVIIIAAAGNESSRDREPKYLIGVSPPAVAEGFISVAALGQGQRGYRVAPFSNVKATLSGPGVGVLSAAPGGGLITKSGTSMATPHVAGVAALWAQHIKNGGRLTFQELSLRLRATARSEGMEQGAYGPDDIGAGMVQAPQVAATGREVAQQVSEDPSRPVPIH
jgi:subtilisin family serine protease